MGRSDEPNGSSAAAERRDPAADTEKKQVKDFSDEFRVEKAEGKAQVFETDAHKIAQRQKQIDFGKNTLGYQRYIQAVPRNKRIQGSQEHPMTPDVKKVCSKRSFDGQIKVWRRLLHQWDPPLEEGEELPEVIDGTKGGGATDSAPPSGTSSLDAYREGFKGEDGADAALSTPPRPTLSRNRKRNFEEQDPVGSEEGKAGCKEQRKSAENTPVSSEWVHVSQEPDSDDGSIFDDWEDAIGTP